MFPRRRAPQAAALSALLLTLAHPATAQLDEAIGLRTEAQAEGSASQGRIDVMSDETDQMLAQYRTALQRIEALLEPIHRGQCEITLGSRFLGQADRMPRSRRLILRLGVLFTRMFNRVRLTDAHNGLRAFSRQAAGKINITLDRMAHASELIDQIRHSGLPFTEVPVRIRYTEHSLAKGQSSRGAFRIAFHYLVGRIMR